ncbi:MAG: histidinol-phosphatase [Bacteroidetes bacterium]|nr:histidinol-phosphatase [Bacteroidota bacterium]MCL2303154.1 histidinol-phosphatase [Lentimicrobiaceae bacterium]
MKCNYHTHTHFCDGKENMRFFVEKAIELQFNHLGFSPHAPILDLYDFTLTADEIPAYLKEVEYYQKHYPQIQIFKGMECDFIPEVTKDFSYYKNTFNLDYIIGGVHLIKVPNSDDIWFIDGPRRETYDDGIARFFNHDIKKAVTCFWEQTYEMIETQKIDIIAHVDKIKMHNQNRFFKEDEGWYRKLVDHAIELIVKNHLIVEINSRGIYRLRCDSFYPSDYILEKLAKAKAPIVISSDAHKAEELPLYYEEAKAKLQSFGIDTLFVLEDKAWHPVKM